ncbi:MAG TPA: S8 family peptidase [Casimicrobiaceae bacterium]|nr:S8 family peptidase [Casimicrobiaceae bacterium]
MPPESSTSNPEHCTTHAVPARALTRLGLAAAFAVSAAFSAAAGAQALVGEIIVKLDGGPAASQTDSLSSERRQQIGMALRTGFNQSGRTRDGAYRLELTPPLSVDDARSALNRLRLDPDIVYASIAVAPLPGPVASPLFTFPTNRLIVKFRDSVVTDNSLGGSGSLAQARLSRISAASGVTLTYVRSMHDDANVLRLPSRSQLADVEAMAARIAAQPDVEFAQPDYIRKINISPSDPCYAMQSLPDCANGYQWDLFEAKGGINAPAAWNITTGSSSIVIGDVDTGILYSHPDLAGRLLPGRDMIDDALVANDNDPDPMCPETTVGGCFGSRDANAADPGDWLTQSQVTAPFNWFYGCEAFGSSFHGSHTAGTIAAAANNGIGIAGINQVSKVLPVRVLGRCGGYTSDIADGIVWASGGTVPLSPANPTPARVLNLSLGGYSDTKTCDPATQNAISGALSRQTVVVVSAGNDNYDAAYATPANCAGVITVAATGQMGYKSFYSNFGMQVEVAAPGGDSHVDAAFNPNKLGILSTINSGVQIPITTTPPTTGGSSPDPNGYVYVQYQGTSMAAPHVTGVVSLMLSVNPALTPAQVTSKVQSTARAFPTGAPACDTSNDPISNPVPSSQWKLCTCTTALCGAGIIDAGAAVLAAFAPAFVSAVVSQNPYGSLSVVGATLVGNTISSFQQNATIQLGTTPGAANSFAQIDVAGLSIGPGSNLVVRSGATGQTVLLASSDNAASAIAGSITAAGGNGAPPPVLLVKNGNGVTVYPSGSISAPDGLSVDTLGATPSSGQPLTVQGALDGGPSLQLRSARITGGGALRGNSVFIGTFGNANNPVNGAHYLSNSLQIAPSTGTDVALTLNGYGSAPQVFNVMVNGNATVSMSSSGTPGAQPNNPAVPAGGSRPAGQAPPAFGGGSMIVQSTGSLKLVGGASNDYIFPGSIVLKAGTFLDLNGVAVNQGWTTAGQAFQGMFFEAPVIKSTAGTVQAYTNDLNWINFSTFPQAKVTAYTLVQNGDGSASFANADATAPHQNTYSVLIDAAANGQCWTCLVNTTAIVVHP